MQLELFPHYPRLEAPKPYDLASPDRSQAWKLFEYPTEDDEPMAQSKKQADTIVYLNSVLEAVLHSMKQDYFIGADVFVYYTRVEPLCAKQYVNSPARLEATELQKIIA